MKLAELLARSKDALHSNRHAMGASLITAAAAGAVAYVGGKAMLTTVALAGGGLFAGATVYVAAKSVLAVGEGVISGITDSVRRVKEEQAMPKAAVS